MLHPLDRTYEAPHPRRCFPSCGRVRIAMLPT
jgi:hypothetical protein